MAIEFREVEFLAGIPLWQFYTCFSKNMHTVGLTDKNQPLIPQNTQKIKDNTEEDAAALSNLDATFSRSWIPMLLSLQVLLGSCRN